MECPKCKNQLKDNAKFCGKCGTKIEVTKKTNDQKSNNNICENCGNPLKAGAKFCGKCGTAQTANKTPEKKERRVENKGYITWQLQPGQIALRITDKIIAQYSKAKGIVIPEGFLVVILKGGKLQTMVEAGTYTFANSIPGTSSTFSRISGFFMNLFNGRKKKTSVQNRQDSEDISRAVEKSIPIEVIVCRSSDIALPFTFKGLPTSSIKVDAGILISIQVSNLLNLYKKFMIDKTVLGADVFAKQLAPYLETSVRESIADITPENINLNQLKSNLSEKLKEVFLNNFPYLSFLDIIKIDTGRKELERLENLAEEMYLSERELEHLARKNEFMNRLSQEQNNAELQNATNSAEFNQRLAEINKDNLLNEEEMANLQRDIQERSDEHNVNRARAAELMQIQHQYAVKDAQIKMEEELGTKLFNIELARQIKKDEYADNRRETNDNYSDTRRQKNSEFEDDRRRAEIDLDNEEQTSQLDILKQAQAIRQEREQAEHNRKMESKKEDNSFELDKIDRFAGMTAEQIMVANPNITKEAASAMAEKFKADATANANDTRATDAQNTMLMMKEFMEQQMSAVRDIAGSNAQALNGAMSSKEREIERTQDMVDKNENRYANVVQGKMQVDSKKKVFCSNCGAECGEEVFCGECGNRVEAK